MFTTGSKYLIGLTAAAAVGTVLYAISSDGGSLGTIGLVSAVVVLGFLVGINAFIREGDIPATAEASVVETSGAAQPSASSGPWPAVSSIGIALVAVGLVTNEFVLLLGAVVALGGALEWLVQGWAERASADRAHNATVRERIAHPLELPIAGALLLGVVVFGFSRLMLTVSKEAGPLLFAVAGAVVLFFGFLIARRPNMSRGVIGGISAVALLALAAGGVASGMSGPREELVTAAEEDHFAAANRSCDDKEHEWDENASQTVSAKANVVAEVYLTDGGLYATQVGIPGELATVTIQRSNPSGVIFHNETSENRRLNLELETEQLEGTDPPVFEQRVICTAMVEEGGAQYLPVTIGLPSFAAPADAPYRMVVPGLEGAEIQIVVP